jgi:hypothetical protein
MRRVADTLEERRSMLAATSRRIAVPRMAMAGLQLTFAATDHRFYADSDIMGDEVGKPMHGAREGGLGSANVPVYNCHACLSPPDAEGWITARSNNLPEVIVRGKTEREALSALVASFKATVAKYTAVGQAIPFADSPAPVEAGVQERWIAVHL